MAMAPSSSSSSSSSPSQNPPPLFRTAGLCLQSLTANILSHLPALPNPAPSPSPSSESLIVPFVLPSSSYSLTANKEESSSSSPSSAIRSRSLSSSVRIEGGLRSGGGGGPAFVGQVFSMLDPSGNGLMTVTSHFDIPFLSRRY